MAYDWQTMQHGERVKTLDLWIKQQTPLPGILLLLDAAREDVIAFVHEHLPQREVELHANCMLSETEIWANMQLMHGDDYPEMGWRLRWRRRRPKKRFA